MDYLPIFADVKRRPCLVVGGGNSAWHKVRMLLKAGADVAVIAPKLNTELKAALATDQIRHIGDVFEPKALDGFFLAIAASSHKAINALVYQSANQRQILVNVVDDAQRCSFIIPSLIDRSPILVAISSAGKAPAFVRLLRQKLEAILPQNIGRTATLIGSFKDNLRQYLHHQSSSNGQVALVGAGPGDAGLLTLRGLQLMQQADVVLYDYLVSDEVMALVRREATLICVGKKAGAHSVPQAQTNQLLVDYAQQGKRVVRLKGGDPFMFGRGAEELNVLVDAGIDFQVVPGITAAAGATAYAGIPLTHRDYAQTAMFITGHLKANSPQLDWATLARKHQTLVIYMGLMKSAHIQQQLLSHGRSFETPIAIIERGTQATQKVFIGQLHELTELTKNANSPALIVVGEVVNLAKKLAWFTESKQPNIFTPELVKQA